MSNKTLAIITDTQIKNAIKTAYDEHSGRISLAKIAKSVNVMYNIKISRQGINERILKSSELFELYRSLKSDSGADTPLLIRESRSMFRGTRLPEVMDAVSIHNITPDDVRGRVVYGELPLNMLHLPAHVIVCDDGNKYLLRVTRFLQHDE